MTVQLLRYPQHWQRDDWLAWRREGIGGSDVAAVCGLSPWATPLTVWLDKTGRSAPVAESEAMRWGNILEPVVLGQFEADTGLFVHHQQTLAVDVDHPHRRATLDGLAADHPDTPGSSTGLWLGVVQAKTTRNGAWDRLPDNYALQVQWEMGITQQANAFVPCLHHGNTFRIYEVAFDPGAFEVLARMVDTFWRDNVQADAPPAVDGDPATTAALRDAFGAPEDETALELDACDLPDLADLLDAREAVKAAERKRDAIENALRLALGTAEADSLTVDGVPLATWRAQTAKGRIDTKAFEAEHPDLAEQYRKAPTTTRVLRVTKHFAEWANNTTNHGRNN